jgi:hypothetical protein
MRGATVRLPFKLLAAVAAISLVACSTSQSPSPLPGTNQTVSAPQAQTRGAIATNRKHRRKGKLTVRIRIPRRHRHRAREPRFISAATKGMTMAFTGPTTTTQVLNLTPSDPRCTGVPLTCTIAITLLAGNYTVTIDTFDEAPVGGSIPAGANLLSTAKNAAFTMAGGITNTIGVTLDGVPASFVIGGLPSGTAGTAFSAPQTFTMTAKDADGDIISGTYEAPVTVSDSDTSSLTQGTALAVNGGSAATSVQSTASSDTLTFGYGGLAIEPATITASASGATNGTGTFTPALQPIVYSGPLNGSTPNVQFGVTSGSFSASEAGWTNAPYSRNLTATAASNCSTIGSVAPGSGTAFTATVAGSPAIGSCTVTLGDSVGQTLGVTLTTPAIGIPASLGSNTADGIPSIFISITATQAAPAASAIIVISEASTIFGPEAPGVACADSAGNTYSVAVANSSGVGDFTAICSAHVTTQLPLGGTITVTWFGTAPIGQLFLANAWSVTGLAGSPLDQTASAAGTGASVSSGATATTTQANELLFGAILDTASTASNANFTPAGNGTANNCATSGSSTYSGLGGIDSSNIPPSLFGMYCIVNGTGAYAANATVAGNPFWLATFATYKGATP